MNTPMSETIYKFPPGYTGSRPPADADYESTNKFNHFDRRSPSDFYSNFRTKDKYNALNNCGRPMDRKNFKF